MMYIIQKSNLNYKAFLMWFKNKKKKQIFKQLNWKMAKNIIEEKKDGLLSVSVGLAEDWSSTTDEVWNNIDGYISRNKTYPHTVSDWATPSIEIIYKDGGEHVFECWIFGDNHNDYFKLGD